MTMAFIFDADAISGPLRPRPAMAYLKWLMKVSREEQFASAAVIGELYKGAFCFQDRDRHRNNIEQHDPRRFTEYHLTASLRFESETMSGSMHDREKRLQKLQISEFIPAA